MNKSGEKDNSAIFDNYLSRIDPQFKPTLIELHALIKSIVPEAEESLSYMVHCFKYIYMLVGIGVTKDYISLYTMSPPLVKQMKNELSGCKVSGTTLHFKPGEPLPAALITRIVLARKQQNELLALARKKKK
jgi:uncharacterized protein YdhG (YjbR/CyaY superfamily)